MGALASSAVRAAAIGFGLALISTSALVAQTFPGLRLRGTLSDLAGTPVEGLTTVTVRVYAAPTGGTPLYSESFTATVTAGNVDLILGIGTGTPSGDLSAALSPGIGELSFERYLTLQIQGDTEEFSPRRRLTGAAFSAWAHNAEALGGQPSSSYVTTGQLGNALSTYARLDQTTNQTFAGSVTFDQPALFGSASTPFVVTSSTPVNNLVAERALTANLAESLLGQAHGSALSRGCSFSGPPVCTACLDQSGGNPCDLGRSAPPYSGYPFNGWVLLALLAPPTGGEATLEVSLPPGLVACRQTVTADVLLEMRVQEAFAQLAGAAPPQGWPEAAGPSIRLLPVLGELYRPPTGSDPMLYDPVPHDPLHVSVDQSTLARSLGSQGPYHFFVRATPLGPPLNPGDCFFAAVNVEVTFTPVRGTLAVDP